MTLLDKIMTAEPYATAKRVFRVVDNGSSPAARRPPTGSPPSSPTR
ncbi:hypothetical protein ACGF0J_20765 [Nonomuraea sp. NPDC047897]